MSAQPTAGAKVNFEHVGWMFVQEYYTFMNKEPTKLHNFYNKKSYFMHGTEAQTVKLCHGTQEIHQRIAELDFQDCKVLVSNVDSQASLQGGILVQVLGELSNKGRPSQKFAQTFFLAEQPNGYYVLNDIFRFLKEDIDTADAGDLEHHYEAAAAHTDHAGDAGLEDQVYVDQQQPEPEPEPVRAPVAEVAPPAYAPRSASPPKREPSPHREDAKAHHKHEEGRPKPPAELAPEAAPNRGESAKPKTWAGLAATLPAGGQPTPAQPVKAQAPPAAAPPPKKPESAKPREGGAPAEDLSLSIFVKALPENITKNQLKDVFSQFGAVRDVEFFSGKNNCFIAFESAESASKAVRQRYIALEEGVQVSVEEKKPRGARPYYAGGQSGRGRGGYDGGDRGRGGSARGRGAGRGARGGTNGSGAGRGGGQPSQE